MPLMTPWRSMWIRPRETIRWIVQTNPSYGVFWLSGIYVLQSLFFLLNFWSFGLTFSHYALLVPSVILAPALGVIWVCFYGWILQSTGRWFGGKAPASHVRAALAWSRLPMSLSLILWVYLVLTKPEETFIQHGPRTIAPFFHIMIFSLEAWTLVLFVQAIREVQHFGLFKALANVLASGILYWIIIFAIMLFSRFISISLSHTSVSFF
jgi:Yip1 domain.